MDMTTLPNNRTKLVSDSAVSLIYKVLLPICMRVLPILMRVLPIDDVMRLQFRTNMQIISCTIIRIDCDLSLMLLLNEAALSGALVLISMHVLITFLPMT